MSGHSSEPTFAGKTFLVTGSSGFVGLRMCEMLVEIGANVRAFDVSPFPFELFSPTHCSNNGILTPIIGDITCLVDVVAAVTGGVDGIFHIAALVGPYHPQLAYRAVNYEGTRLLLEAAKTAGVPRFIFSSSPSTRFDGNDIIGRAEDELEVMPRGTFLEEYAETKALAELAVREACCSALMTVAIAPHQVYGPRDSLFLPNFLKAARSGLLRVFGDGQNEVSFTYVDNYCSGLFAGYQSLYKGSPALGKFFIVTDGGGPTKFWLTIDAACMALGCDSIMDKFKLPSWLMMGVANFLSCLGWFTGCKFRLTPFAVKMTTIHRWFNISAAKRDLNYVPAVTPAEGWKTTVNWFAANEAWWLARAT